MSRGLSKLQREVLRIVDADHRHNDETVTSLTRKIHGEQFTAAERQSVARAVATLAHRGLVETYRSAKRLGAAKGAPERVLNEYIEGESQEPTAARGKLLKAAGMVEYEYQPEHRVPIGETFVVRPKPTTTTR